VIEAERVPLEAATRNQASQRAYDDRVTFSIESALPSDCCRQIHCRSFWYREVRMARIGLTCAEQMPLT